MDAAATAAPVLTNQVPWPIPQLLAWRRYRRLQRILGCVKTWPGMKVLDVGCGIDGRSFSDYVDPSWLIIGIDQYPSDQVNHTHPNFTYVRTDARALPFPDNSFDLLVSVGLLEHIVPKADYDATRKGFQRIGRQYAIVVPYKWAWIEPHYGIPFFGAMPKWLQRFLIRLFNINGHRDKMDYFENFFIWRSNAEYLRDFPGAYIRFMPTLETIAIVRSQ